MIKFQFFLLSILLVLTNISTRYDSAQAQTNSSKQATSEPPKPPSRGTPSGREGSATRGSCEQTDKPFTPLLPVINSAFSGLTFKEHPTFWFYIPYKTDSVSSGQFVLEDQEGNLVYQMFFKLSKIPGFVSISIPTIEKPLEKNKPYNWKLGLFCTSQNSSEPNPIIEEGVVERVDMPNLESQLRTAQLEERIRLYADRGIWYDVSTDLAQIRERPQAWVDLLKATGLEQLKTEAVVGSVIPIENKF